MIVGGNRHSRMVCEECFKWASQRKVFGKTLISQPMIRFKLAQMIAEVESVRGVPALVFEFSSLVFECVNVSRLRHRPTRHSNSNDQMHT